MPAAVMGDMHACSMPPLAGPHPPTPIAKGSATVLIGGRPRGAHGRHERLRRADRDGHAARARSEADAMSPIGVSPAFLGRAGRFPVVRRRRATIATAAYEEDIRQAILIILGTDPGERVMRPDFGAGLRAFVFEPMNADDARGAARRGCRKRWSTGSRASTSSGRRHAVRTSGNGCSIDIAYRVRATNAHPQPRLSVLSRKRGGAVIASRPSSSTDATRTTSAAELLARARRLHARVAAGDRSAGDRAWRRSPRATSEAVVQRLNQAPEKSKLAFLDTAGARADAGAGGARAGRLPAGERRARRRHRAGRTPVAAPPPPGSTEQIVFETERAVGVIAGRIAQVVSLWPGRDEYIDHSADFLAGMPLRPFSRATAQPTPHVLYSRTIRCWRLPATSSWPSSSSCAAQHRASERSSGSTGTARSGAISSTQPECGAGGEPTSTAPKASTRSGRVRLETDCADAGKTTVTASRVTGCADDSTSRCRRTRGALPESTPSASPATSTGPLRW